MLLNSNFAFTTDMSSFIWMAQTGWNNDFKVPKKPWSKFFSFFPPWPNFQFKLSFVCRKLNRYHWTSLELSFFVEVRRYHWTLSLYAILAQSQRFRSEFPKSKHPFINVKLESFITTVISLVVSDSTISSIRSEFCIFSHRLRCVWSFLFVLQIAG